MSLSIDQVEQKSGVPKKETEGTKEYLQRVGRRAGVTTEDVERVCDVWQRSFAPNRSITEADRKAVERFTSAVAELTVDTEQERPDTPTRERNSADRMGETTSTESPNSVKSDQAVRESLFAPPNSGVSKTTKSDSELSQEPLIWNLLVGSHNWLRDAMPVEAKIGFREISYRIRKKIGFLFQTLSDYTYVAGIAVIGFFLYYDNLGSYPLVMWDESIYAIAAKHMAREGYWLVPHVSGGLSEIPIHPFLEKPPLVMWLQAFSILIFGVTELAVRLQSATFAILTAVVVYVFGRELHSRRVGVLGGVVFLTTPAVYGLTNAGRLGGLDIALVFFGTLLIFFVWLAIERDDSRLLVPGGLAASAAVLTKGAGAGIFVIVLAPVVLANVRLFICRDSIYAVGLFLLTVLPWPLYVWSQYGDRFLNQIIFEQVLSRAAGGGYVSPEPKLFGFMRYPYFQNFPLHFDPWAYLLLPATLFLFWRSATQYARKTVVKVVFLLWWATIIIVFFSLTGNHGWYLLPMYVPSALVVGWLVTAAISGERLALAGTLSGAILMLLVSPRMDWFSPLTYTRPFAGGAEIPRAPTEGVPFLLLVVTTALALAAFPQFVSAAKSVLNETDYRIGKHVIPVVFLVLFALVIVGGAPTIAGAYGQQEQMAQSIDSTNSQTTIYISEGAVQARGRYVPLAFYTNRTLAPVQVATLKETHEYVLVASSQLPQINQEYTPVRNFTIPPNTLNRQNVTLARREI
jgi:4-amino-4-deoxy-L-arabinose transferase-like glycosyltransferase